MKYSLRSLMIVVTLACVVLGVEYANGYVAGYKVRYPSDPATTFAVPISEAPAPIAPKK